VVAGSDQRAELDQRVPGLRELGERSYLPGEVIQAQVTALLRHAVRHREQAEVVVVRGALRPQERGLARYLHPHLEAEGLAVERDRSGQIPNVEHGVVKTADRHLSSLTVWLYLRDKAPASR
jgi:hypothetical protein